MHGYAATLVFFRLSKLHRAYADRCFQICSWTSLIENNSRKERAKNSNEGLMKENQETIHKGSNTHCFRSYRGKMCACRIWHPKMLHGWFRENAQLETIKQVQLEMSFTRKFGAWGRRCRRRLCWFRRLCTTTLRLLWQSSLRRGRHLWHLLRLMKYAPHHFRLRDFFWRWWWGRWWSHSSLITSPIRWWWWRDSSLTTSPTTSTATTARFAFALTGHLFHVQDGRHYLSLGLALGVEVCLSIEALKHNLKPILFSHFLWGGQNLKEKHMAAKGLQTPPR